MGKVSFKDIRYKACWNVHRSYVDIPLKSNKYIISDRLICGKLHLAGNPAMTGRFRSNALGKLKEN